MSPALMACWCVPSLILDGYVTSLVSDFDWMDLFGSVHGKVNLKYGQNVIVFDR